MGRRATSAEHAEFERLYGAGMTLPNIADRMKRPENTLGRWRRLALRDGRLKRHTQPPSPSGGEAAQRQRGAERRAKRAALNAEILRLREAGLTQKEIARAIGMSQTGVSYVLLANGRRARRTT